MVMTDQEIIDSIIKGLNKNNKASFRGNDLLDIFIIGKDLISQDIFRDDEKIFPELVQTDYFYFKQKLMNHLSRHNIHFITGPDDFLDIFANKDIYNDYMKVYNLQHEIDNLDIIASNVKHSDEERIAALENMYEKYNEERDILDKYEV